MAVMMGSLYTALREAGAPDDKAQKAAEEVAGFDNRIGSLDARVMLLTWMVGTNIVLTLSVLGLILRGSGH